ncbi:MAG: hypothetical protein C0614_14075 [Desulfuromonas sp.]|nr:MAG: hypothetical protein C0614_14075 [Desulfuromonas sp.]
MSSTFQANSVYIKLDDDMPVVGRWFYAGLALLLVSFLTRVLNHKDTNLLISLTASVVLVPTSLWFVSLAAWRKKVTINKLKKSIDIESGFIREMFKKTHYLQNFNRLEVDTERTPAIGFGGAPRTRRPDKITKKFYFVGKEKLLVAKRCYSANDKTQEGSVKKLEYELRGVLESS